MKKNLLIAALLLVWLAFGFAKPAAANSVSNSDQLLSQHLDSIANAQSRAALKTRVAQGPVEFKILVGGAGTLDGKAVLVSEGKKFQFMMKLPNPDYRGEQFIFDGDKDSIAFATNRQSRSALGSFMFVQDAAIREGLWGGALSTAWPLLNVNEHKAKLTFEGLKKVDGEELYEIRYHPQKKSDLEISLYFDPQTCHHVETVYFYSSPESLPYAAPGGSIAGSPTALTYNDPNTGMPGGGTDLLKSSPQTANARLTPNRYRLRERFSDFKTVDGVTLPTHYDIQFSQELQNGKTTLSDWDIKGLEVSNNIPIDGRAFEVK